MIGLISMDYQTRVAKFSVDTEDELNDLPRIGIKGKSPLDMIGSCNMGSLAIVTETSEKFILSGDKNKWVKAYSPSGGGGELPEDYEIADKDDIDNLF